MCVCLLAVNDGPGEPFAFICLNASRELIAVAFGISVKMLGCRLEKSGAKVSGFLEMLLGSYGAEKGQLALGCSVFHSSMSGTLTLEGIATLFLKAR